MGIHYDYKSTRGAKAMEKQAKREKKLAEKRAKKLRKLIEAEGLTTSGNAKLAVYDNPMSTLPFLRRNEIHIPLKNQKLY